MEFHNKEAIYLQIVEMVCEKILNRQWGGEDKLPSVRELAVGIEVNPNTVLRAYGFLQEKGIIQNKRGIGYFVSKNAYTDTLAFMKSKFIKNDLPLFFKAMKLLDIGFDELEARFAKFEKEVDRSEKDTEI
jgi:DNA-binding transcriptional regulator YhcF (GntR family)